MSKSLCATRSATKEHVLCIKQIETSYTVSAKVNTSINNRIAVTGQSLMTNLKHQSVDYDHCDGLYAAAVDMNANFRQ